MERNYYLYERGCLALYVKVLTFGPNSIRMIPEAQWNNKAFFKIIY